MIKTPRKVLHGDYMKDVELPVQEDFDILEKRNALSSQVLGFIVEAACLAYNTRGMLWTTGSQCKMLLIVM